MKHVKFMNNRLLNLKSLMLNKNIDGLLISSVPNITYLTGFSNFSKDEREAFLLIVAQPQGLTHGTPGVLGYILTDGRYSEAVKKQVKDFELIEISSKLSFGEAIKNLTQKNNIKRLGFEGHNISFLEHKRLSKYFNNIYHLSISNLRSVKTPDEISKIEKACELGDKAFEYVLKKIKEGISEKEIALEIEFFIKKQGANISFPPIVAFGKNSSVPHHQASDQRLTAKDQIVLLDFGVKLNNYCSDMTRTVFFGSANAEFKKMYQTVLEAQQKAIQQLNNLTMKQLAIKASEIDKIARDYITTKGFPTIPHSLGHGIGLEVHESPRLSPLSKDILKENMVFSIEPGIYIPGFGGVRIEDLVVLGKSGPRFLTRCSRELIEL
ncbi:MAG: aminopeptidase P family protein [Candidatus Levybacteria bacterium]|nr:aminopeptidase P family protein [Candidatus Levybacteria bacterium]